MGSPSSRSPAVAQSGPAKPAEPPSVHCPGQLGYEDQLVQFSSLTTLLQLPYPLPRLPDMQTATPQLPWSHADGWQQHTVVLPPAKRWWGFLWARNVGRRARSVGGSAACSMMVDWVGLEHLPESLDVGVEPVPHLLFSTELLHLERHDPPECLDGRVGPWWRPRGFLRSTRHATGSMMIGWVGSEHLPESLDVGVGPILHLLS